MNFKYGDLVRIRDEEFFNEAVGEVIDYKKHHTQEAVVGQGSPPPGMQIVTEIKYLVSMKRGVVEHWYREDELEKLELEKVEKQEKEALLIKGV